MNVIRYVKPTYCEFCKTETIECFNVFNKPIFYNNILSIPDNEVRQLRINNHVLSYMMCTRCKRKYRIDWTDKLPKPLRHTKSLNLFTMRDDE